MLGRTSIVMKGIFVFIAFSIGFSQVTLEIKNLDTSAGDGTGSLDVYMTNYAACGYCSNTTYSQGEGECISKGVCKDQSGNIISKVGLPGYEAGTDIKSYCLDGRKESSVLDSDVIYGICYDGDGNETITTPSGTGITFASQCFNAGLCTDPAYNDAPEECLSESSNQWVPAGYTWERKNSFVRNEWITSTTIDQTVCVEDNSGIYFGGEVSGFQITIKGIDFELGSCSDGSSKSEVTCCTNNSGSWGVNNAGSAVCTNGTATWTSSTPVTGGSSATAGFTIQNSEEIIYLKKMRKNH